MNEKQVPLDTATPGAAGPDAPTPMQRTPTGKTPLEGIVSQLRATGDGFLDGVADVLEYKERALASCRTDLALVLEAQAKDDKEIELLHEQLERCRAALLAAQLGLYAWDESQHPRVPKGSGDPSGEFAPKINTEEEWAEAYAKHLISQGRSETVSRLLARETARAHKSVRGLDASLWPSPTLQTLFETKDDSEPDEQLKP